MKRASLCLLAALVLAQGARAATARLVLDSDPGDPIGEGQHYELDYSSETSQVFSLEVWALVDGQPSFAYFSLGELDAMPSTFADLYFDTTMLDTPLRPGSFLDAQRAPFAAPGHPGLDVSFQFRGSNQLTGQFTIDSVTFTTDAQGQPTLETFAVRFEQHTDGAEPALRGSFRYDARAVPEPGAAALLTAALALAARRLSPARPRRRSASPARGPSRAAPSRRSDPCPARG